MDDRWGAFRQQSIGHGGKVRGRSVQSAMFYHAFERCPPINTCQMRGSTGTLPPWPIDGTVLCSNLSAMAAKCRAVVPNLSAMAVKALVSKRSGGKTVARGARSPTGHRTRIHSKKQKCITNGVILLYESWPDLGRAGLGSPELAWAGLGWPGLAWAGLNRPGLVWPGLGWPGLARAGLVGAGLIWAELGWAGLRWAGLACAGLGWPGRKGRHVPRRARGAGATSQMYGAARALPLIAPNHPGLPQTIWKYRELQWVTGNNGLSLSSRATAGPAWGTVSADGPNN